MKKVLKAISNDKSRFVGRGKREKDSCYEVHEVEGKFYSIIVYGRMNVWLMDDSLKEIKEEDIEKYVEKF
jgi:hypothetical protein